MEKSIEEYLINRGYPVSSKGGIYFSMLLEEVIYSMINSRTNEEIREELPILAEEYYKDFFKIDEASYLNELQKFCDSVKNKKDQKNQESIEDKLIRMGRDIVKNNNMDKENHKIMCKCK